MTESAAQFNEFLDSIFQYGAVWVYAVLFAACLIENVFPPFPGDMFILAAGGLIAVGRLMPLPALVMIVGGGMCSVMLLYVIGRRYGRDYVLRKNFRYFSAADVARMEKRLASWGWLVLLFSRFVPGVRSAIALAAGIARYPQFKMAVLSGISYVAFSGLLLYLAAKLVNNIDAVGRYFALYNKIIWPIIIVGILAYVIFRYRKVRKSS
ncbi:hypothetical protein C3F09_08705 [candidate division GN15 bacterium]|uniref:VTT domain-containing protein n=1 Tax=candidate division GN15 bacterium TaxID=2072418 RepID=A0A855WZS8_9BACT|nr:MAG: hypothetical protein C3F09_08705 [candidate division GN15 bacterium]